MSIDVGLNTKNVKDFHSAYKKLSEALIKKESERVTSGSGLLLTDKARNDFNKGKIFTSKRRSEG